LNDVEQTGNHGDPQPLQLTVALAPDQLELLASQVADVLERRRDDGSSTSTSRGFPWLVAAGGVPAG
jgi:hypothetical protein